MRSFRLCCFASATRNVFLSFPGLLESRSLLPLDLLRPGPWFWIHVRRQGNGIGRFLWVMADHEALSVWGGKPAMEFSDRVLKCVDCGAEFVFTAGEQLFFYEKHFKNDPRHCKQCKAKRASGESKARTETRTTCSECGAETTVPFKPTQGRPVLCRSCFQKQKQKPQPAPESVLTPSE
jgi:CxxC-x17-CxxC domain-containing protein